MIYILSSYNQEGYQAQYILEGPEQKDWKQYCQSFMDEAGLHALEEARQKSWWMETSAVLSSLVEILKTKGYTILLPIRHDVSDFIIGFDCFLSQYSRTYETTNDNPCNLSKEVFEKIVEFNKKLDQE